MLGTVQATLIFTADAATAGGYAWAFAAAGLAFALLAAGALANPWLRRRRARR